jgi:ELWxxDGT repeat protein
VSRRWWRASDRLFFVGNDGEHGTEPWVSDGSELGTRLARDIVPGLDGSGPSSLTPSGARAYFSAFSPDGGEELWISDGSEDGTRQAADINPGSAGSFPFWLVAVDGRCVFTADEGDSGEEIWISDGTADGTVRIADLRPGPQSSIPTDLVAAGDLVFFNACPDAGRPCGLWRTDGSSAGTLALREFVDSGEGAAVSGALWFRADDGETGSEPWRSDGSVDGTRPLANLAPDDAVGSAYPTGLTEFFRRVLFVADDGTHGEELWISGGTAASTHLVKDINPDGAAFGLLTQIVRLGNFAFFAADDGAHGIELWRSDGTEDGTRLWKDVAGGPASGDPRDLVAVDDARLFFVADEGLFGRELWRTDNDGVTTPITDIYPGVIGSDPRLLTAFRGGVAFTANDGTHGTELWVSDGSPRGTYLVRDINPKGSAFLPPGVFDLAVVNDILYFTADDGEHGVELWASDGSEDGTYLVRDIRAGPAGSEPQFLRAAGEHLALLADDGVHGVELWRSDGSVDGTSLVADIHPRRGAFGTATFFFSFGSLDAQLYFAADDGMHGVELWRSDLTIEGTSRVADINPGPEGSYPAFFTAPDPGELLFQAYDPSFGFEPWRVTPDGTVARLADLAPGAASSNPTHFTVAGERVFFSADNGSSGSELWIDAPCAGDCGGDDVVSIDELIRGVRIALGGDGVVGCLALDRNADDIVTIDELIAAVNAGAVWLLTAEQPRIANATAGFAVPPHPRRAQAHAACEDTDARRPVPCRSRALPGSRLADSPATVLWRPTAIPT